MRQCDTPIIRYLMVFAGLIAVSLVGSCGSSEKDTCNNVTCADNASCNEGQCLCNTGYKSENPATIDCILIDPCKDVDCPSHASCNDGDCVCDFGYYSPDPTTTDCFLALECSEDENMDCVEGRQFKICCSDSTSCDYHFENGIVLSKASVAHDYCLGNIVSQDETDCVSYAPCGQGFVGDTETHTCKYSATYQGSNLLITECSRIDSSQQGVYGVAYGYNNIEPPLAGCIDPNKQLIGVFETGKTSCGDEDDKNTREDFNSAAQYFCESLADHTTIPPSSTVITRHTLGGGLPLESYDWCKGFGVAHYGYTCFYDISYSYPQKCAD